MTPEAFERALRAFRRRPFRPIVIELVSGDRLLLIHPDNVARFGDLFYFCGSGGDRRLFVSSSVCQLFEEKPAS